MNKKPFVMHEFYRYETFGPPVKPCCADGHPTLQEAMSCEGRRENMDAYRITEYYERRMATEDEY